MVWSPREMLAATVAVWLARRRLSAYLPADVVIDAATQALVEGLDSPTLRELAGLSPHESEWVVEPLANDVVEELDLPRPDEDGVVIAVFVLQALRLEAGECTPRDLTAWSHDVVDHDGPEVLQDFVEADDEYDDLEIGGRPTREMDERVRRLAQELLADPPPLDGSSRRP
jgi:hypothetical protein